VIEMSEQHGSGRKLTLPQVKKQLETIGEANLDQFQRRAFDYTAKFSRIDSESAEKLLERFVKEFGLEEDEAVQVLNCMPKSVEELRVFLAGGRKIIETGKLETIVNILNENRKL
jgi:DNA-directed RNA polymerase subunit F